MQGNNNLLRGFHLTLKKKSALFNKQTLLARLPLLKMVALGAKKSRRDYSGFLLKSAESARSHHLYSPRAVGAQLAKVKGNTSFILSASWQCSNTNSKSCWRSKNNSPSSKDTTKMFALLRARCKPEERKERQEAQDATNSPRVLTECRAPCTYMVW